MPLAIDGTRIDTPRSADRQDAFGEGSRAGSAPQLELTAIWRRGVHEAAYSAYAQAFGPAEARYRIAGALYSRGDRAAAHKQLAAGVAERPNHAPTLRMLAALDAEIAGGNHRRQPGRWRQRRAWPR